MGIFNIFKKRNNGFLESPIDFGILGTDIHSHLIPGIDDGAKTMEDSIYLIKEMSKLGYKKLITTPHIMNDYYKNTPEIILSGLERVRKEISTQGIDMQIEAAAEYMLDDGFEKKMKEGKLLTFGDNYVLIEMSYVDVYPRLSEVIFDLQMEGYKVVLAHPERYNYWHQDFNNYKQLTDRGVFLQLNINSLTGWYSHSSKIIAKKLIARKMISFLGSDLHNDKYLEELQKSRLKPSLKIAIDNGDILNITL